MYIKTEMEDLRTKYDNAKVRRQDRLLSYDRALEILNGGEYGFLALGGDQGYGVPVNFVLHKGYIYFHCAPDGEKLRRITTHDKASFCIVGHTAPQPAKFTTEYESVIASGKISLITDDGIRMEALEALVEKYSPDFREIGRKYAEKSFHRTAILCLEIGHITGKCKQIVKSGS